MKILTYDFEVSRYDWLVVFKDYDTKQYVVIHNSTDVFQNMIDMHQDAVFVGFNSKSYDRFIAHAIYIGCSNQEVKAVNDWIISGNQGWECPVLRGNYFQFNNVDIRDDMQQTLSLKSIEGHLGLDIVETEVDFDLDRPWTRDELEKMIFYCKRDVDATEKIMEIRKDYLNNKINIGKLAGLEPHVAMGMTNAKLTAAMLKAEPKQWDDEREYVYPDNLDRRYIPQEVLDFFNKVHDKTIPDETVFSQKLETMIGDCPVTLGFGGIHGAIPNYIWKEGDAE